MNSGWVKLHRTSLDNEIISDTVAWQVFTVLLMMVDKDTGKVKIGRLWMSKLLGLHSSTFYKALIRLSKKYGVITLNGNNKYTEVYIVKWVKYQTENNIGNNKVTTKEQQSNSKVTHNKNRELRIKNNILPERSDDLPEKEVLEKLPNKNDLYRSLITYCREKQGISREYPNYVKQTTALKRIFGSGYSEPEVKFVIEEMSKDTFWQESPFDLMTVANQMHKYLNRTVLFKKGGQRAFN